MCPPQAPGATGETRPAPGRQPDYAEDKLPGPTRQDRRSFRRAIKRRVKQASADLPELAESICQQPIENHHDMDRAKRVRRALWNDEVLLLRWIDVMRLAALQCQDVVTPYGTRVADDAAIAGSEFRGMLAQVRTQAAAVERHLTIRRERVRYLAWTWTGEDYVHMAQGRTPDRR